MIADAVSLGRGINPVGLLARRSKGTRDVDRDRNTRTAGDGQNTMTCDSYQMRPLGSGDLVSKVLCHRLRRITGDCRIGELGLRRRKARDLRWRHQISHADRPRRPDGWLGNGDRCLRIDALKAAGINAVNTSIRTRTLEREVDCVAQPAHAHVACIRQEVIAVVGIKDRVKRREDLLFRRIPSNSFGRLQARDAIHVRQQEA